MFHTRLRVGSFANKRDLRLREFGVEHVKGFACATYALLQPSKVLSGWCSLSPEFLEQQNSFLECVARVASTLKTAHSFWSLIDSSFLWTPKYTKENKINEKHHKHHPSFWTRWRLAAQVSSYLDSEGLCAERATSRAKSLVEAQRVFKRLIGIFKWNLFSFRPLSVMLLSLLNLRGPLLRWRMEFVQLWVAPLSPVLLRGQQSSRNSQRLTARAWVTTRVSNTYVSLPKIISPSMQDFEDSIASSAVVHLGWVAGGRETQEHWATSWNTWCNKVRPKIASTSSQCHWVTLFWRSWKTLFEAMPTAKAQPNVISAATSACERGGQRLAALTLFEAILKAKVQPNGISAAISACERGE